MLVKNQELLASERKLWTFKNQIMLKTSFNLISMLSEEMLFHVTYIINSAKNSLLIGGDGRYLSNEVIGIICKIACANGIDEIHVAKDGLMSTPACSAYIRQLNEQYGNCIGGILLTASHNPGGPHEDFGIKFNSRNGGPALEEFTNLVHSETIKINEYKTVDFDFLSVVNLSEIKDHVFENVIRPRKSTFVVKVVENVKGYV